jgi:hypothetical protein
MSQAGHTVQHLCLNAFQTKKRLFEGEKAAKGWKICTSLKVVKCKKTKEAKSGVRFVAYPCVALAPIYTYTARPHLRGLPILAQQKILCKQNYPSKGRFVLAMRAHMYAQSE